MLPETRLPLNSLSPNADRLAALKTLFPEAFAEGKIDFDKLKQALGEAVQTDRERYGLTWAGKTNAIHTLQSLSVGTLKPDRKESVNFDTTENLIIEGDNLEVLKLLQKSYFGKVKMIYIDPPYNTGNEFIYPDNFREGLEDYLKYSGQISAQGTATTSNKETDGRYHSKWLSMMYPRLFLAKNLLRDDGVVFISIDDHEVYNLGLLMNEIFGEENFLAQLSWKTDGNFDNQAKFKRVHEYILVYAKRLEYFPHPPVIDPATPKDSKLFLEDIRNTIVKNGPKNPVSPVTLPEGFPCEIAEGIIEARSDSWPHYVDTAIIREHRLMSAVTVKSGWSSKDLLLEFIKNQCQPITDSKEQQTRFVISGSGAIEAIKKRTNRNSHVVTSLTGLGGPQKATSEIEQLGIPFDDYPKPTSLIQYLLQMNEGNDFIVLDFFAGSGTTAHAVLKLNNEDGGKRKFLLVQLPEKTPDKQFPTIAHITRERVRSVIKSMNEVDARKLPIGECVPDRGFKALRLAASNFKIWDDEGGEADADAVAAQLELFADNLLPDAAPEDILFEILLKAGYDLNVPREEVVIAGQSIYSIAEGQQLVCLERDITRETLAGMIAQKPKGVICLDEAFHGNDALLTNTLLQMQDADIRFHTV